MIWFCLALHHRMNYHSHEYCYEARSDIFGGEVMNISDRIFERLHQIHMTQKEFSELTGIAPSTISEWKSKRTNPTSEKIMIICKVLDVTPEWILSGVGKTGNRGNDIPWYVIDKKSDIGMLIEQYNRMDEKQRDRLKGYLEAMRQMKE